MRVRVVEMSAGGRQRGSGDGFRRRRRQRVTLLGGAREITGVLFRAAGERLAAAERIGGQELIRKADAGRRQGGGRQTAGVQRIP